MYDFLGSQPLAVRFFIAFLVVLVLIGVTAWVVRRFAANRLGGGGSRGRQPRLAVIDAATVDGRRRLVLIRRDNVEHLLMIGGPTDVVVEQNIVRAAPATARETTPARSAAPEPAARAAPALETAWPLQPSNDLPPVAPIAPVAPSARALRSNATDEPWLPPEPGARPRPAESFSPPPAEPAPRRAMPDLGAPPPRLVEAVPPPPLAASAPAAQGDHNLAAMAQQLEAALRRPPVPENRPPVTDALAMPPPPKLPEARAPSRDFKPRAEPKMDAPFEPKSESKFEPKFEPKADLKPPALKLEPKADAKDTKSEPGPGKALYDNLEEEMASLLGRPPGKP